MTLFPVVADAATGAFLEAAERGAFLAVRNRATGEWLSPHTDVTLSANLEYAEASGRGHVVSWAVNHGKGRDGAPVLTTYGIVELDEGPWWWTEITGGEVGEPLTGRRVHAEFVKSGPGDEFATVPVFALD